uniref:Zinc finger, CCHC-type n=1 Tax=Tanacetum cinerariifolium TaxID=118510 RepID=A0A699H1C3_TANCI|nr:zinc finger, CCHC-type [Tanacetum cinerariifolium]
MLSVDDKLNYLEHPIPAPPVPAHVGQQVPPKALAAHVACVKGQKEIDGLMLMTMELDIQQNLENLGTYDMLQEFKTLFSQQAEQELLQISYIDNLERLGHVVSLNLVVSRILVSLRKEYDSFVQNYNMHGMGKTGLKGSKKLKPGALSLYVGNGHHAAVEAIGSFHLCLPSGLVDGIHEINLSNSNTNDSSMYAVSNKRAKLNLDSTLLWNCRLGHISKKRIKKLQQDGLLNSTDIKSFKNCVSCTSEKMAQKPYSHQVERAKDLLRLIHTNSIFASSSVKAEYIVTLDASKEAVWVRKFIYGLSIVPIIEEPIKMYCDNTGVVTIVNESGITKGARRYCTKVHYLCEVIEFGDVKIEKVHTDDNLANPFTKALLFPKHSVHTKNIGVLPATVLCKFVFLLVFG